MSEARTVSIRPSDYDLLKKYSSVEGRGMTEILHRALEAYGKVATSNAFEMISGKKN